VESSGGRGIVVAHLNRFRGRILARYNSCVAAATLFEFARVNDAAAATTKKLAKQSILAAYLRAIDSDDDLRLAVRYASGHAFAAMDERVLGASGATVSDAVLTILKVDPDEFWSRVVKNGEIGQALADFWDRRPPPASSRDHSDPLTLRAIADGFDELASTGNQQRKREIVRDLFARCADPREAAYLAKIIFSDLRTGVRDGVLIPAIAEAFARDNDAVRRAQLLVGDLGEVAVLARHDRLTEARFQLFHPIQFMLATPQETADVAAATMDGKMFFAEDKLDGIRAQVHKQGEGPSARVAIYTRTMDRTDESFPDVVESVRKLPGDFLLDGEIVPWRDGVVLPFAHIQKRLGRKVLTQKIIRENPAVFIAFDILYLGSELLMHRPLRDRRAALARLAPSPCTKGERGGEGASVADSDQLSATSRKGKENPVPIPLPEYRENECPLLITAIMTVTTAQEIDAAFCKARDCRNEGLVLKDPDSAYSPGRRGQAWLKLKTHLPTFDCVVTAAEFGHGKRRGVLSDYTFAVWNREPTEPGAQLVNIGKAYSGVTDEEIAHLTRTFLELSLAQRGHVHVVQPKVVLEIACDQIQKSARHASGYALRFPRIKRIRWDKAPEEADRLSRIAQIYDSVANTARGAAPARQPPSPEPTLFD
jgi:DNA ligase-1